MGIILREEYIDHFLENFGSWLMRRAGGGHDRSTVSCEQHDCEKTLNSEAGKLIGFLEQTFSRLPDAINMVCQLACLKRL